MGKALFVTATDTGAGKTFITGLTGRYLRELGLSVVTQKWAESGSRDGASRDIRAHDRIIGASPVPAVAARERAPYVFRAACSPHLAARRESRQIRPAVIRRCLISLRQRYDAVIVEGAGGILVPLTGRVLLADMARAVSLPALLVVNNKLGAINHALMTVESLKARGIPILGLVFNAPKRCAGAIMRENPRIVARYSGAPVLGVLPTAASLESAYKYFLPIGARIWRSLRALEN